MGTSQMEDLRLFCVRADYGTYTHQFLKNGFVGIGWLHESDLSKIKIRDELYSLYQKYHPDDTSNVVIGQQVGQISRFLLEISKGDYVITPDKNTEFIHYGIVDSEYYYSDNSDGCPYNHRKRVKWIDKIPRSAFSVPFQNSIRSSLTVFSVNHIHNFLDVIGVKGLKPPKDEFNYYKSIIGKILELDDKEFEILITHILTALGFEGSKHTGKVGDGGVDAIGELNVSNMAKIKLFVQAKRYKIGSNISGNTVKALRANIPSEGQGAFITTSDFQKNAKEVALEAGFPRIGLINGEQLVDILAEHWNDIPEEFRTKLDLKVGLVPN
ncbi:MAG: hypothetical protein A2X64_00070 [Ignavibacteria bacterium GWF2_33_9]|nr:MAG: hypothetical protein A2X64_00070 [Ignavibacteria bacterium GWF2_33_9]